jgi:hypothetical protein
MALCNNSWINTIYNLLQYALLFFVIYVFTSPMVTASKDGSSPFSGFLNCLRASGTAVSLRHSRRLCQVRVKVKVMTRPAASRPVCPGVWNPSGVYDQNFVTVRHLRSSCCRAPSLTIERVCNLLLQLLLGLGRAVTLGSKFLGTHDHILLSIFLRISQTGGPGPRIYIPPTRVAQLYHRALGFL